MVRGRLERGFPGGVDESVQAWSDADINVSPLDRGVRVERWMRNAKAPTVGGEQLKEPFAQLAYRAFSEDRAMLTAQQRIIDAEPSRRMMLFGMDRAPILYGRLVEKLLKQEADG